MDASDRFGTNEEYILADASTQALRVTAHIQQRLRA